jgi:phage terminase small subunit
MEKKQHKRQAEDRHELFCQMYTSDPERNATRVYKTLYPNCKAENSAAENACKLLKTPKVRARIAELERPICDRMGATREWIVEQLIDVVVKSKIPAQVEKYDPVAGEIVGTGEFVFDSHGANKALEILGKIQGMFIQKIEQKPIKVSFDNPPNITVSSDNVKEALQQVLNRAIT